MFGTIEKIVSTKNMTILELQKNNVKIPFQAAAGT
jgi:hypothetical protein